MILTHKDWLKVPTLMEELRGLFEELPDEELAYLKRLAINAVKSCSDRRLSEGTQPTHSNVRLI